MNTKKIEAFVSALRELVDFLIGWLKWATATAIAVALFVMVAEQFGFHVPYVAVSSNVTTWAYLAGIYWLSR